MVSLISEAGYGAVSLNLTPNPPGPQKVGQTITWTAVVSGGAAGRTYDYQFSVAAQGQPFMVRRDFHTSNTFEWTPRTAEGTFLVRVLARDITTTPITEIGSLVRSYSIQPRITPTDPNGAVHTTGHPLVALFSGPACNTGNFMRVRFQRSGSSTSSATNREPCNSTTTMNFYVAGMLPASQYMLWWETVSSTGQVIFAGPQLPFTTGNIPSTVKLPTFTVNKASPTAQANPIVLHHFLPIGQLYVPTATNMSGQVVWYYQQPINFIGRTNVDGNMMVLLGANASPRQQIMREIDLAGNTVLETNAAIINEQLAARRKRPITGFHHEVRRIYPSGNILILAANERAFTNVQGGTPQKPVNVIGDVILILDANMRLLWSWDAFDHLDVKRAALLNEQCQPNSPGCPPFSPAFTTANDWLHSNSVQVTSDGNLLLSMRHQDWVIKINYANGTGDGKVIWRLGKGGDFAISTNGTQNTHDAAWPWFSHQHDPEIEFNGVLIGGSQVLTIFDNGNLRRETFNASAHSRGQIYAINEAARQVNLNMNADLGEYSFALGSANLVLSPGVTTASFGNGIIGSLTNAITQTVETDLNGSVVSNVQATAPAYRTFRMRDMYTPPTP